jgi:uncharacterized protein (DUF433 family)
MIERKPVIEPSTGMPCTTRPCSLGSLLTDIHASPTLGISLCFPSFLRSREKAMNEQLRQRISLDPKLMLGKPVIRGTRIPVELIVRMLAQGVPESDSLREYPRLQPDDIRAALDYAARVLAHEDVFPLTVSA